MKRFGPTAAIVLLALLLLRCGSEEEVTGPDQHKDIPTHADIAVDNATILSGGREVSTWSVQLVQVEEGNRTDLGIETSVHMLTDKHGYFLEGGEKTAQISFETNSSGQAKVEFYGAREPEFPQLLYGATDSASILSQSQSL